MATPIDFARGARLAQTAFLEGRNLAASATDDEASEIETLAFEMLLALDEIQRLRAQIGEVMTARTAYQLNVAVGQLSRSKFWR